VDNKRRKLDSLAKRRCLLQPLYYVEERAMRLDQLTRAFVATASANVSYCGRRLASLAGKLDAMSPLRVIARGYAVVTKEDVAVTSVNEVKKGDELSLLVGDGQIHCRVETTKKERDIYE
jgi:exodeoxyribonuclease VII large subunit